MVNSGLDIASSLVSIHCPILYCGYFVAIFASLQLLGSNVAVNADGFAAGYFGSLVPSYSALCRTAFIPALRLSQRFLFGGFGALLGFACVCLVGFKPFGPLALVQQAPPAIILAALLRFGGPALFHGLRPSSSQGALLAFGSNFALKRTGFQPAAYLGR